MKKDNKVNIFEIIQWIAAVFMFLFALVNGMHYSTIFLVLAGVLFMPIPAIRNFLKSRLKIKNWITCLVAFILFISATNLSPQTSTSSKNVPKTTEQTVTDSNTQTQKPSDSEISNNLPTPPVENAESLPTDTQDESSDDETITEQQTPSGEQSTQTGSQAAVNPTNIAEFSGKAYIVINDNNPTFSKEELTSVGYEKYSPLDNLGRTCTAIASVGKDTMPKDGEKRGDISSIKPSGWKQAKYDCVSGGWLYNRCHLIGWQLSAENANKGNLLTGTKYLNTSGMLPFENMVADYIKETGNHVAYRITPIYIDDNLVASGVQMEAYSVEDDGEGICFNVYCYNVQPQVTINYKTGESTGPQAEPEPEPTPTPVPAPEPEPEPEPESEQDHDHEQTEQMVWLSATGKKYHSIPNCGTMNPDKARQVTLSEAKQKYTACSNCW